MNARFLALWSLVLFSLALFQRQANGEDENNTKPTAEYRNGNIVSEGGGLIAHLKLGDIEPGAMKKFVISLHNSTPDALPINKMTTHCSCLKVKTDGDELPGNGSLEFDLEIKAVQDLSEETVSQTFEIYYSAENAITVAIQYRLSGLVSFRRARAFVAEISDVKKPQTVRVPVLITAPVRLEDVAVVLSKEFDGCEHRLNQNVDSQWLEILYENKESQPGSTIGSATLKHEESGASTTVAVVLEPKTGLKVAPSTLRFRPSKDDKTTNNQDVYEQFVASAIVSVDSSLLKPNNTAKAMIPRISVSCDAPANLTCKKSKLLNGITRIQLSLKKKIDDDFPEFATVVCRVGDRVIRKKIRTSVSGINQKSRSVK